MARNNFNDKYNTIFTGKNANIILADKESNIGYYSNIQIRPNAVPNDEINPEFTIVLLMPLTGFESFFNLTAEQIIKFSDNVIWNVIYEDTMNDANIFLQKCKYYINLGVRYFIGGLTSDEIIVWNDNIKDNNVTLISPSSTAILDKNNNIIRLVPNDKVTAKVLFSYLDVKKTSTDDICVLAVDSIFGRSLANEIQKIFANQGTINTVYYTAKNIDEKSKQVFSTYNKPNQYVIIVFIDNEIFPIFDQRGNSESNMILPEALYNDRLIRFIDNSFISKIFCTSYIGASTITSLDRTNDQTDIYDDFGIYAAVYDLNIIDALRFFDLIVRSDDLNADEIASLMESYYGITGNLHLDIDKDRNNDAFSIGVIRIAFGSRTWQDISYQALKDTIVVNGSIVAQTLSSFPEIQNVNLEIVGIDEWDLVKYTNLNGMTYYFSDLVTNLFSYPISLKLELISGITIIFIPPTASVSTPIIVTIVQNNNVISVSLSGLNRILVL